MVISLSGFRDKIQTKIFDAIGTDGALETVNSNSTDKWGDATITYNSSTALQLIPFNTINDNRLYEPFGDLGEKETDVIIPYDTSFSRDDRITFDGQAYKVINTEKFLYQGGNLAWAVRLVKEH